MTDPILDSYIGREIDGYKIEKLLGRGGMARVYRGYDEHLHRYVAVKVIDPRTGDDLNYQERFKKEARAIARLRHQNIVGVHRFGMIDNRYYMVMDYIDGTDLRWMLHDYHKNGELMPYDSIRTIIDHVARALDYAHKQGIIHRDVKPSNIMINGDGDAILTDFGLVRIESEETKGEIFGSPHYIAPEQAISSASVTTQSDLYSLGIVLYEMLTGKLPYTEGSAMEIAMAHMIEPLPDPLKANPKLDPAFVPVLKTALEKEPQNRYQTGAKFVAALRAATKQAKERGAARSASSSLKLPRQTSTESSSRGSDANVELQAKVSKFREENPSPPLLNQADAGQHGTVFERMSQYQKAVKAQTARTRRRGRARMLIVFLLLVLIGVGVGAMLMPSLRNLPIGVSAAGFDPHVLVNFTIEGPVRSIENNTLHIYDLTISIDDAALLDRIAAGDTVRIEGRFESDQSGLRLVAYRSAEINGDLYPEPTPTPTAAP